jgi:hypothetical protein
MKNFSIKFLLVALIFTAVMLLTYVVTTTEIKRFNKEKVSKQEIFNERESRIESKIVEIQKLTSEDRIVKFAVDSLNMLRPSDNLDQVNVSKEQINQIEKLVNEKYD